MYLNDEIIAYMIREAQDEKSKFLQGKSTSMGKSKADTKLHFLYHVCLPDEIATQPDFVFSSVDKMKELDSIRNSIRAKIPLEFLTMDVAIDSNDKLWIIEINSEPGSSGIMMANLYESIFRDFYKREMEPVSKKCLEEVKMKLIAFTMRGDNFRFSEKFIEKYIG